MTTATATPTHGANTYADVPATARVARISSGAYATDDSASLAKTGNAIRFGSSVSCSLSLRSGRPMTNRFVTSVSQATWRWYGRVPAPPRTCTVRRDRPDRKGPRAVHIVIMGCGRGGSSLAHRLEQAGHAVAIIDQNPSAFRRLGPEFTGTQVTGIGFDQQTLLRAGIEEAGAFAAVYERLGIPTIATVPWTTEEMLRAIIGSDHSELWRDSTGRVVLAQLDVHEGWVGHRLSELEAAAGARVVFVSRFGEAILPDPTTVAQSGDLISVAMTNDIAEAVR